MKEDYIINVDVHGILQRDKRKIYPYLQGKENGKYLAQYYKEELLINKDKFIVLHFPKEVIGVGSSFIDGFFDEYKSFAFLSGFYHQYFTFAGTRHFTDEYEEEIQYLD